MASKKHHLTKRVDTIEIAQSVGDIFGGVNLESNLTFQEALEAADLDWETLVAPVRMGDKLRTLIPGLQSTYRRIGPQEHVPFGIRKGRYTPIHNHQAFGWIANTNFTYVAAGMIDRGRRVWMAVEDSTGDSPIRPLIVILNSNDGSSHLEVHLLPVVSALGLVMNFHGPKDAHKIRHTKGSAAKLKILNVDAILKEAGEELAEMQEDCRTLMNTNLTSDQVAYLIPACLGATDKEQVAWSKGKIDVKPHWVNQWAAVEKMLTEGPTAEIAPGTAWQLLLAVDGYFDYVRTVRGAADKADNLFESRMFGYSATQKYLTFQFLVKYCHKQG